MWLEVLSGEDAGRVVEVDRPLVLGRVQGADVVIRDARASRRHAEVAPEGGGLRLRDLGLGQRHPRRRRAGRRRRS